MILEVAILDVIPGQEGEFQAAFTEASSILSSMQGYVSHQLQRCLEAPGRYILLVNWETLERTRSVFAAQSNLRNGNNFCTISTIHFPLLNIMR